jgi:serine/threonine-protein kinase
MKGTVWISCSAFILAAVCCSLGACAGDDDDGDEDGGSSGDGGATADDGGATGDDGGATGDDGGGTGDDGGGTVTGDVDECGNAPGQLLLPGMPWNTPVDAVSVDPESDAIISYLAENVIGDDRFQIDFSLTMLEADADTPRYPFEPTSSWWDVECDGAPIPVPEDGHLEGEAGYTCDGDGDCHLIVVQRSTCRLYEQWKADFAGPGDFEGGCLAVWELDRVYDETLRGDYCTSADAAGLPIAPLLFTADEVAAGAIEHAVRFVLPNAHIRADIYVRPGTHSTGATGGPPEAPPYAARLRLKAGVDTGGLNPAARVVAEALRTYGMILADGGRITFTAGSDDFGTATWDQVGLGPHDLKGLSWTDFEVVDGGERIAYSEGDCQREPIDD